MPLFPHSDRPVPQPIHTDGGDPRPTRPAPLPADIRRFLAMGSYSLSYDERKAVARWIDAAEQHMQHHDPR